MRSSNISLVLPHPAGSSKQRNCSLICATWPPAPTLRDGDSSTCHTTGYQHSRPYATEKIMLFRTSSSCTPPLTSMVSQVFSRVCTLVLPNTTVTWFERHIWCFIVLEHFQYLTKNVGLNQLSLLCNFQLTQSTIKIRDSNNLAFYRAEIG